MRKDNPFYENRLSKTAPAEVLEKFPGLERPFERAVWALETPYLLPLSYGEVEPEGLFDSILEGKPLVDLPHCRALVSFFQDNFEEAKNLLETAPEDPYTAYNLILCLEALGERERPIEFWQDLLGKDLEWLDRIAIYEHLRSNYALHGAVQEDLKGRFSEAAPEVMLKLLAHLVLHRDFELAEQLWVQGAIAHEELENFGVDLALAQGKLALAISRMKNLTNPRDKAEYIRDFIKVVALKALEDGDFAASLEMTETLLDEFFKDLSKEEKLFYLRLKCFCSLKVLERDVDVNSLSPESKQNLLTALTEIRKTAQKEAQTIKSLAETLNEPAQGAEDDYTSYLDKVIETLESKER